MFHTIPTLITWPAHYIYSAHLVLKLINHGPPADEQQRLLPPDHTIAADPIVKNGAHLAMLVALSPSSSSRGGGLMGSREISFSQVWTVAGLGGDSSASSSLARRSVRAAAVSDVRISRSQQRNSSISGSHAEEGEGGELRDLPQPGASTAC